MSFLLAQLKKDTLVARPILVGWGICVAVSLLELAQHASLVPGMSEKGAGLAFLGTVCLGAQPLLLIALFVRVIQTDSLADESAFWLTRPIPRLGLLGAKALLLAPLFVVSMAVQEPLLGHSFVSPSWSSATIFVLGAAAFASVTSTFGRAFGTFLLVCVGIGVAAGIAHGLMNASVTANSHSWSTHLVTLPAVAAHENEISTALFLLGFPLVIVHQYRTLRTRASLGMLAGIFALAALL